MKKLKNAVKFLVIIAVAVSLIFVYFKLNVTVSADYSFTALSGKQYHLTAHRGLSSVSPENTLPALEEAGKAGYYAAEFDIRITKDGEWVLMHDETVDRTTNGTGEVALLGYAELLELDIDGGNGIENHTELKIPTLEQALEICSEYSMRPMIEIKGGEPEDMQSVLEILSTFEGEKPLIIDFDGERLSALRALDADIELWYLKSKIDDEAIAFAKDNSTALAFNYKKLTNYFMLEEAKAQGILLASWTVDELPAFDLLNLLGVDYVTTNRILP